MQYSMTAILSVVLAMQLSAQAPAQPPSLELARFEVVSVKPNATADASLGMDVVSGRLTARANLLIEVISNAHRGFARIVDAPDWVRRERFDIVATFQQGTTTPPIGAMLRVLLADRFAFRAHSERRPLAVHTLVKDRPDGRLGPGMRPSTLQCSAEVRCFVRNRPQGTFHATGYGWPGGFLLGELGAAVGTLVLDRTGITGRYDIDLEWAEPNATADQGAGDRPSVFTAVREQLGLRLVPATESMDVLVIDHVERPTPD